MENIVAYIDAYNLYHSLKEKGWTKYYWLNIPALIQGYIRENQCLKTVYYFTSSDVNPERRKRQRTYIEALETLSLINFINFRVIQGRFESEDVRCNVCNEFAFCKECGELLTFNHEKETDVNIAIQLLSDAYEDVFDIAFLLTADSDQVGTIKAIKKLFHSTKKVGIILPPGRSSKNLEKVADFYLHIDQNSLGKNQLPDVIIKPGGYSLKRPVQWH